MDQYRLLQWSERLLRGEGGFHELHPRIETITTPPRTRLDPPAPQKLRKIPDAQIYPVDPPAGYNRNAPLHDTPKSAYPSLQSVHGAFPGLPRDPRYHHSFSGAHLRIGPYLAEYYLNTSVRLVPLENIVSQADPSSQSLRFHYDQFLNEVAASTTETNISPSTHDIACAMTSADGGPEEWRLIRSEEHLAGALFHVIGTMRRRVVRIVWWRRLSGPARFATEVHVDGMLSCSSRLTLDAVACHAERGGGLALSVWRARSGLRFEWEMISALTALGG